MGTNFFGDIINWLRGIKASVVSHFTPGYTKTYLFGQVCSGTYSSWKHDSYPTILCMGTYIAKNGKSYVHGWNLHYLSDFDKKWLMNLIYMMKRGGQIVNPRQFYYYIKINRPSMRNSYRIYHTELCNYYTISPGFSNASVSSCYSVRDYRDGFVKQLNQMIDSSYNAGSYNNPSKISYDKNELQEHIQEVLNSRKIW